MIQVDAWSIFCIFVLFQIISYPRSFLFLPFFISAKYHTLFLFFYKMRQNHPLGATPSLEGLPCLALIAALAEALLINHGDELGAVGYPQLMKDVGHMVLDGMLRDE